MEQCGITIQSADPVPLFTVVISGLFTSGASFSLAHEYSTRNQNRQLIIEAILDSVIICVDVSTKFSSVACNCVKVQ